MKMALTEKTEIDRREVLVDGTIQARTALIVERDGVEISRTFINRQIFVPGSDVSGEDETIQRLASVEHTSERIAAYEEKARIRAENAL